MNQRRTGDRRIDRIYQLADRVDGVTRLNHVLHARGEHGTVGQVGRQARAGDTAESVAGPRQDDQSGDERQSDHGPTSPTPHASAGGAALGEAPSGAQRAQTLVVHDELQVRTNVGPWELFELDDLYCRHGRLLTCYEHLFVYTKANSCSPQAPFPQFSPRTLKALISTIFRPTRPKLDLVDESVARLENARATSVSSRTIRIRWSKTSWAHSSLSASSGWSCESVT